MKGHHAPPSRLLCTRKRIAAQTNPQGSPAILDPSGSRPWLPGGSGGPWLCVPGFRQVCFCQSNKLIGRRTLINAGIYVNWTVSKCSQPIVRLRLEADSASYLTFLLHPEQIG